MMEVLGNAFIYQEMNEQFSTQIFSLIMQILEQQSIRDPLATLYCLKLMTITIKMGKGISQDQSIAVLKMLHTHLFVSSLTSGTADAGAIAAALESSLLYCGHVVVILSSENNKKQNQIFN